MHDPLLSSLKTLPSAPPSIPQQSIKMPPPTRLRIFLSRLRLFAELAICWCIVTVAFAQLSRLAQGDLNVLPANLQHLIGNLALHCHNSLKKPLQFLTALIAYLVPSVIAVRHYVKMIPRFEPTFCSLERQLGVAGQELHIEDLDAANLQLETAALASRKDLRPSAHRLQSFAWPLRRHDQLDPDLARILDTVSQSLQTTCFICFTDFEYRDNVIQLPCRHFFHAGCIKPWLEDNFRCAICRRGVCWVMVLEENQG